LDDKPILIHSNIYEPNIVVVVDETLIDSVDVTAGIQQGGAVIVNTGVPTTQYARRCRFSR
jgi:pyruvate ferredoxin oxidoreductase gamma subunit